MYWSNEYDILSSSVLCVQFAVWLFGVGLYVQCRTDNLKLWGWRSGAKRKGSESRPVGQYLLNYIAPGQNPSSTTCIPFITSKFHVTSDHIIPFQISSYCLFYTTQTNKLSLLLTHSHLYKTYFSYGNIMALEIIVDHFQIVGSRCVSIEHLCSVC
jgi:hypothetical protein